MYYVIFYYLFIHLTFNVSAVDYVSLCTTKSDICICEAKEENELYLLTVDCSFQGNEILNTKERLPVLIQTLDLSKNNLTFIKKSNLLNSYNMKILKLNRNKISNITVDALYLPNLQNLDLSENDLEFIDPEIFSNIKNLKYLNIASNKFKNFATMIFHHLSHLEMINLDFNDIGTHLRNHSLFQRNELALTTKIKAVSMAGVHLDRVPDNFLADAYDLRNLIISGNNLTEVPELPFTIEYLDISDNPIFQIDSEDFSNLPSLKELKLNNLLIKEIPDYVFAPLKTLRKLSLERNSKLTMFSALAFGREVLDDPDYFVLEELSIRGARIKNLSEDLITPFGQLIKLDLQGNLWHCDCKLLWIKRLQIPSRDRDHVRCYTPMGLYNSRVFDLDDENFVCSQSTHRVFLVLVVAVCMALSAIACALFTSFGRRTRTANLPSASQTSGYSYVKVDPNTKNDEL